MGEPVVIAIASVISVLISGAVGYATQRSASKSNTQTAEITSLAQLEREAGERAARVYKGLIDQLEEDQREDREEISQLRTRVHDLEKAREQDHQTIEDLRGELAVARKALQIRYPDEP